MVKYNIFILTLLTLITTIDSLAKNESKIHSPTVNLKNPFMPPLEIAEKRTRKN